MIEFIVLLLLMIGCGLFVSIITGLLLTYKDEDQ